MFGKKIQKEKKLLSGIQPSGRPHIGNYFGAMKQFVDFQNDYECLFMIADYHALNSITNREEMHENIVNVALDYLAIGIDPKKSIMFKQSDVPQHAELAWIFETITTMPYLMRAHAFKDAEAKNKEISVGTFNYPMLMAADILLYDANIVPVGQDQKQHVEFTRDIAEKFNRTFGETFILPQAFIKKEVAIVPGIDGQKMSKSYKNTIPLFANDEEIRSAVMSIVTDSSGEIPKNVYEIHKLFKSPNELDALYEEKKGKYKDLKEALIVDIQKYIRPLREKREALAKNKESVIAILNKGGESAKKRAQEKMKIVKEKIGVSLA